MQEQVPKSLKIWFIIHFVADMLFAFPLLFFPTQFLNWFGFVNVEMLTARLVGAALIGIGGNSLLMHKKGKEVYKAMLDLKIIWSLAAIFGLVLTILSGAENIVWFVLGVFVIFSGVWIYYRKKYLKH